MNKGGNVGKYSLHSAHMGNDSLFFFAIKSKWQTGKVRVHCQHASEYQKKGA